MTHQILTTAHGEITITRFYEKDSPEQLIYGRGDPAAVVAEELGGDIFAIFPDAGAYDQAVALEDEFFTNQPEG